MYTLRDQLLYTQLERVVRVSRTQNQEIPACVLGASVFDAAVVASTDVSDVVTTALPVVTTFLGS